MPSKIMLTAHRDSVFRKVSHASERLLLLKRTYYWNLPQSSSVRSMAFSCVSKWLPDERLNFPSAKKVGWIHLGGPVNLQIVCSFTPNECVNFILERSNGKNLKAIRTTNPFISTSYISQGCQCSGIPKRHFTGRVITITKRITQRSRKKILLQVLMPPSWTCVHKPHWKSSSKPKVTQMVFIKPFW